jgi:3-(3-hydroxy-phenyl)propionate hydroxylase
MTRTGKRDNQNPVCVIGAGPAGLTAALGLAALGVPAMVIESDSEDRIRRGSRALYVHRESLQTLELLSPGLGYEIARRGICWTGQRTTYRGRAVFVRDYNPFDRDGFPPYVCLRQIETEGYLLDACKTAGVQFIWDAPVDHVQSIGETVDVVAKDGRRWRSSYVIAGDGSRSVVRDSIGRTMIGARSTSHHVVVDLADDPHQPAPAVREFHYHHPAMGDRHVLIVPFAGGRQVDLQCLPDDDPDAFLRPDSLQEWIPRVVDDSYSERILWSSRYPFLQLVADEFVSADRRVLLIGEAAHLFAPFGARGMNSAIADADCAATAVAVALASTTAERAGAAIDNYNSQRRAAAIHNRDAAGSALAHMRPATVAGRTKQRVAASISRVAAPAGEWLEKAPYGPRTRATATSTY